MVSKQMEALRQSLKSKIEERAPIIKQSTAALLEQNEKEQAELREMIASLERVENSTKHSIPPSAEENDAWTQIRRLSDEEASILRHKMVPERYVRADALEYFAGDLKKRRADLEANKASLKPNQWQGPRAAATFDELQAAEHRWAAVTMPICVAGQRLFAIREEKQKLSEQRDALRLEREEKALAGVR